jgi:uncharacterized protein (DUF3084 family)
MSDDLKNLQNAMTRVQGHLQDLQNDQKATTHELKGLSEAVRRLEARSLSMEAGYAGLNGTFASIEQIMTKALGDHARVEALEKQNVEILRRLEALERRAS